MATNNINNNEQSDNINVVSNIGYKRRHLSQTPIPSNDMILQQLDEEHRKINFIRKRRALSEQINFPIR